MNKIFYGYNQKESTIDNILKHTPKGWENLVVKLIDDLFMAGWDGQLLQIKSKFGGLRFYVGVANDAIYKRIAAAEQESYLACEVCGATANPNDQTSSWNTFCKECNK